MIGVTGANGKLGVLTVNRLLRTLPGREIVALVRDLGKADELRGLGVQVREGDYDRPETLRSALQGVNKVLLISSSAPGDRLRQHQAVIDASLAAGVKLLAYTSVLRADTSKLWLAGEHRETENALKASGLNHVLLRYGWYIENNTDALPNILESGQIVGTSGDGVFSGISRADCAAAAAAVLTQDGHASKVYDVVGEQTYSVPEVAAEISKQSGRKIAYKEISAAEYTAMLLGFGLPELMVKTVVDAETQSKRGDFKSDSKQLRQLTGEEPLRMQDVVRSALASVS